MICYAVHIALEMELHEDTDVNLQVYEGRYAVLARNDNGMGFWHTSLFRGWTIVDWFLSDLVSHGKDRHEMAGKNKLHAPHWSEILNLFLQAGCFPWYFVGVCFLKCRKRRSDQEVTVSTFFRVDMADTTLVEAQVLSAVSFVLFHLTVILLALTSTQKNMWIIALVCHIFFSIIIGAVRHEIIKAYNINGDAVRNVLAAALWYPWCLQQMYKQLQFPFPKHERYNPSFRLLGALQTPSNNDSKRNVSKQ